MQESPVFVAPMGEIQSHRAQRVAVAKDGFDRIHVNYPPQTAVIALLDEVRLTGRLRDPGTACGGAMLVAPHGTGKTMAIRQLARHAEQDAIEGQTPVLRVEIATQGTTDSVPSSILHALGTARPDVGTERARWFRAVSELQRSGVELVVFDEFNRAARRPTMSRAIATAIRERIMDAGICPVAFVGSEDAGNVLSQTPELMERLEDEVGLAPLDWLIAEDRDLFLSFVDELDAAMAQKCLLAGKSDLAVEPLSYALWEATQGRVRRINKVVRHAMASAVREGHGLIYKADLADAVDIYCMPRKFCTRNPFI